MKQCTNEMKEKIALYYDGVLSDHEIAEIDEHILGCSECREELELYRYILDELCLEESQEIDILLPSDFHTNVMNRIKDETIKKKATFRFFKFSPYANLAATFVLVMFLAIIGFLQNGQFQDKSESVTSLDIISTPESEEKIRMDVDMTADTATSYQFSGEVSSEASLEASSEASSEIMSSEIEVASEEASAKITMEATSEDSSLRLGAVEIEVVDESKMEWNILFVLIGILTSLLALVIVRVFYNKNKRMK